MVVFVRGGGGYRGWVSVSGRVKVDVRTGRNGATAKNRVMNEYELGIRRLAWFRGAWALTSPQAPACRSNRLLPRSCAAGRIRKIFDE